MNCKDCYHYEACKEKFAGLKKICVDKPKKHTELNPRVENRCQQFKDNSQIIELPNIEIGQELFYIDKYGKRVESDTVSKLTFEKNDLGIDTGVWSDNYGFSEFFSDVGKTLFLTKEEAEAKLKELNNGTT